MRFDDVPSNFARLDFDLQVGVLVEVDQRVPDPLEILPVEFLASGHCVDNRQNANLHLGALGALLKRGEGADGLDRAQLLH